MSCRSDAGAPRKLICVLGVASGVPGSGEIVTAGAGAVVAATALPTGPSTDPSSPAKNSTAANVPARMRISVRRRFDRRRHMEMRGGGLFVLVLVNVVVIAHPLPLRLLQITRQRLPPLLLECAP